MAPCLIPWQRSSFGTTQLESRLRMRIPMNTRLRPARSWATAAKFNWRGFFALRNYRIILPDSKEHLMAETLTWDDAERIGVLLARKHPELYPLSTDLDELRRQVTDLEEFKDDLTTCDENKLEAIRTAWNEEVLDRTQ
jgi:FeS assembly protein IscX